MRSKLHRLAQSAKAEAVDLRDAEPRCSTLLHELASAVLAEGGGWRIAKYGPLGDDPRATAPASGREVLVCALSDSGLVRMFIGCWLVSVNTSVAPLGAKVWGARGEWEPLRVTHWRPLPGPPAR